MAKPIPAVEPVTSAFLSVSCKSIGASLSDAAVFVSAGLIGWRLAFVSPQRPVARRHAAVAQ
jgi:hypothetical protein